MRDGLYQVTHGPVCAGFVVADGRIQECPPLLRARGFAGSVKRLDEFYRILVTGSREWRDAQLIRWALVKVLAKWRCRPDQMVVVQGMAEGADRIARSVAMELGMRYEDHPVTPADWRQYGRGAGHRRNAVMVAAGARGCVAFPLGESRGTRGCMRMCEAAGIKVWNCGCLSARVAAMSVPNDYHVGDVITLPPEPPVGARVAGDRGGQIRLIRHAEGWRINGRGPAFPWQAVADMWFPLTVTHMPAPSLPTRQA